MQLTSKATRSILVLRHAPFEHLGYFGTILATHGIPFQYFDHGPPGSPPSLLDAHEAAIVLGGPMSANDPLLTAELKLIERVLDRGMPLLGVCLGSQLIAKALGARVYRNSQLEIGWAPVYFTEGGQRDSVFAGMASPSTFFHWHGETFDLPAGAEWLAFSDRCRNQAYRYGRSVYGIQFHPEITPEMIADWCAQPVNCGDVKTLGEPIDPRAFNAEPLARQIAERWLAVAGSVSEASEQNVRSTAPYGRGSLWR